VIKTLCKILGVLLLTVIGLLAALSVTDTDRVEMLGKYGQGSMLADDGFGGKVVYKDHGPRNAKVLFLVHGSNASMQTWNQMVNELSDEYRVITYDQHGHGLTGPNLNGDYSAAAKIKTALQVLDHAKVERAVWIGNSMGGWLSWRAALSHPDRISKMVLIDASGAVTQEKIKPYLAARLSRSWFGQLIAPFVTSRFLIKKSLESNYADVNKIDEQLIDQYWEMIRFPGNRSAIGARANTSREPEKWQEVSNIRVPTLLLWGEQDNVIPLAHGKAFNEKIKGSQLLVYSNAAHLPHEEIPQTVANDIRAWLHNDL